MPSCEKINRLIDKSRFKENRNISAKITNKASLMFCCNQNLQNY